MQTEPLPTLLIQIQTSFLSGGQNIFGPLGEKRLEETRGGGGRGRRRSLLYQLLHFLRDLISTLRECQMVWRQLFLKQLRYRSFILKKKAKLFKIVIFNSFQSTPSSAILVPFCFRITPFWCFSSLVNHFFLVSQHFNRNLSPRRNDSKYRDVVPLSMPYLRIPGQRL